MEAILNVVLPVFGIMAAGFLAGRLKLLGDGSSQALNAFVFYISLPALFLVSLSRVPISDAFDLPFLLAYGAGMVVVLAVVFLVARFVTHQPLEVRALQAMSALFANTGYMGIPLLMIAYGEAARLPSIIATIVNGAVVMGTITVLIEVGLHQGKGLSRTLKNVALAVARNPLVISAVLGLSLSALQLPLPTPLATFCDLLGATAGPCALFAIGLFMVGKPLSAGLGETLWLSSLKLLLQPLVTAWLAFVVLDLAPVWAASATILAALPTGTLTFVLASRYQLHQERTTAVILVSTLLSVVTLSLLFVLLDLK